MRIIPAIDVIDGKCVRLTQGDYSRKKIYNEDPLEVALQYEDAGLNYLHLVDLDGAKQRKLINWKVIEKVAAKTQLRIDVGGGIQTDDDIRISFECGAKQVNIGSIAVKKKEKMHHWLATYGPEKVILSADVYEEKVAVSGWQEQTAIYLKDLIEEYMPDALKYVVCTDISKDGMLQGPNVDLYKSVLTDFPELKLIASGGVAQINDLEQLAKAKVEGVIIGKAIYEGNILLSDLKTHYVS